MYTIINSVILSAAEGSYAAGVQDPSAVLRMTGVMVCRFIKYSYHT